jgi:hypothetical protein
VFWDRLPITVAFMGLFAAFIADRIDCRAGLLLLPVLVGLGIVSVIYWAWSESVGQGDLRPYAVVQFFPMLAIPLICVLFPPRWLDARFVVAMVVVYGLAKLFELLDERIFDLLGGAVSGHSLKHVAAAAAAYVALVMLQHPARQPAAA